MDHLTWPADGRYIVAVSGGADSIALLDLLASATAARAYELVVAHFDHGLRTGAAADRRLVETAATHYQLPFVTYEAQLGQASEAAARQARYTWLEQVRRERHAAGIITAHHQDDLLETSLLNLARGSGRRGLAPMRRSPLIIRPLLGVTRARLRDYAAAQGLVWHEDPTNADVHNPRNLLRHRILPALAPVDRRRYLELLERLDTLNQAIDAQLDAIPEQAADGLAVPRTLVRDLSLRELEELIVTIAYRLNPSVQLRQRIVREAALFAKTGRIHHDRDLPQGLAIGLERGIMLIRLHHANHK